MAMKYDGGISRIVQRSIVMKGATRSGVKSLKC